MFLLLDLIYLVLRKLVLMDHCGVFVYGTCRMVYTYTLVSSSVSSAHILLHQFPWSVRPLKNCL